MTLSAEALCCQRGGRQVFESLSFSVASGRALLVTGRNGAGKSSLLRMIAGLLRIAGGKLTLSGGDDERSIGEQAHYLGHLDALKPALSVEENLSFWTRYLGGDGQPPDALAAVGLDSLAHLPAAYLSAGQKRRLSIARLVAIKRPLWLLDEPTSALDTKAQAMLLALMQAHLAGGGMIVAATHLPLGLDGATELRLEQVP
ncbi:heme ABC exporter ATP-binding protein CcmA [Pseudorhodoplanes sinuspersici]|uniref:Heme ABC exporter ATP-binding protein CcmA n=1 Tax=Pseudorhodoplanes sinuspersici TaxID=1235591 RepID=A0A1W6ZNL0_9HYPH|nr:heme ABC exporter ATP-binding protein CcmA [Pseudorhodoplanes sinuspersici]ARP98951.1 heme ABC exporter ATP-binding protein CcmA [Pseudorhodoplanes sinuspersici]RKE69417.1 heme exporter protein A [Pseudorhodoplanes sinuspersici]